MNLVGPTLLAHGTPEQKAQWLPRILDATEIWCQLFSEPGAGSDLTSLTTRATKVDGGFVVNGQKVWTSYAQFADWGWCLARTDPDAPKSKGISALAIDMHAPGVEVRPLRQITDESEFNEVFFTDVFVPDDRLVGPLNEGWRVANSTLTHERGVNPRQLVAHSQLLDELWKLGLERDALDDPRLAGRLAQAFVEVRIFQLHNWRSISRTAKGAEPGPVGSINKLWWSEMSKRLHDTAMAVVGPAQPLWRGAQDNPGDGAWQRSWLYYQASSIWAGTNEIQRNVIGERILGLPRWKELNHAYPPLRITDHATTHLHPHGHCCSRRRSRGVRQQQQKFIADHNSGGELDFEHCPDHDRRVLQLCLDSRCGGLDGDREEQQHVAAHRDG